MSSCVAKYHGLMVVFSNMSLNDSYPSMELSTPYTAWGGGGRWRVREREREREREGGGGSECMCVRACDVNSCTV